MTLFRPLSRPAALALLVALQAPAAALAQDAPAPYDGDTAGSRDAHTHQADEPADGQHRPDLTVRFSGQEILDLETTVQGTAKEIESLTFTVFKPTP